MKKHTIILLRHGQYTPAKESKLEALTALGRKQAAFSAKKIKEYKIDQVIHSTMPRAHETALIVIKKLGSKRKLQSTDLLRECVPGFPKELRKKFNFTNLAKLKKDQNTLDQAFKKYFKQTRQNKTSLLVCHGNVIRYLICKALDINTITWLKLEINQCAVSIIEIRSRGGSRMRLLTHNDVSHIPPKLRTFI